MLFVCVLPQGTAQEKLLICATRSNIKHRIRFNSDQSRMTRQKKNNDVFFTKKKHWSDSIDNNVNRGDVLLITLLYDSGLS